MAENGQLSDFDRSLVALGISAATAFSLPKSVGAIFGLAFASPQPLALDDFVERLEISKGSASQGLKFLQRIEYGIDVETPLQVHEPAIDVPAIDGQRGQIIGPDLL